MNEFEALALAAAAKKRQQAQQPNQDGTYGSPPDGMFLNPQTGQMTSRELMTNALPTSRPGAFAGGVMQGYSVDTVDEAAGAIGGQPMRERSRAQLAANARDYPGAEIAGRVVGAVASPINKLIGPVRGFKDAAKAGAVYGGIEGFFSGEDSPTDRLKNAGWNAASGALFGGLTERAGRLPAFVKKAFSRADERPTIEALYGAKNAAYEAVRRSGFEFSQDDMIDLWSNLDDLAKDARWDLDAISEMDKGAIAALRTIQRRAEGGPVSLNNLDKTRQKMWDLYTKSDEPFILEAISAIDGVIAKNADGNELIRAARDANSKHAKTLLLDNALNKAKRQTARAGSGGNIANNYRAAIDRIISNPREAKWFTPEELALMDQFVLGDTADNVLRRAGKLAPGGNGLMQSLMVYGALVDPATLVIGAAGQGMKTAADSRIIRGAGEIQDAVSTGIIPIPAPKPDLKSLAVGGAAAGNAGIR